MTSEAARRVVEEKLERTLRECIAGPALDGFSVAAFKMADAMAEAVRVERERCIDISLAYVRYCWCAKTIAIAMRKEPR